MKSRVAGARLIFRYLIKSSSTDPPCQHIECHIRAILRQLWRFQNEVSIYLILNTYFELTHHVTSMIHSHESKPRFNFCSITCPDSDLFHCTNDLVSACCSNRWFPRPQRLGGKLRLSFLGKRIGPAKISSGVTSKITIALIS